MMSLIIMRKQKRQGLCLFPAFIRKQTAETCIQRSLELCLGSKRLDHLNHPPLFYKGRKAAWIARTITGLPYRHCVARSLPSSSCKWLRATCYCWDEESRTALPRQLAAWSKRKENFESLYGLSLILLVVMPPGSYSCLMECQRRLFCWWAI